MVKGLKEGPLGCRYSISLEKERKEVKPPTPVRCTADFLLKKVRPTQGYALLRNPHPQTLPGEATARDFQLPGRALAQFRTVYPELLLEFPPPPFSPLLSLCREHHPLVQNDNQRNSTCPEKVEHTWLRRRLWRGQCPTSCSVLCFCKYSNLVGRVKGLGAKAPSCLLY